MKSAVIGCGGIAQVHAEALRELGHELAGFADIKLERAEGMAESFGGRAYSDYKEMLQKERPQVVHICTPHYLHVEMAEEAAKLGIAVFTEKPPAIDRGQFERLRDVSKKVRLGICFQNRFNDSVNFIRQLLGMPLYIPECSHSLHLRAAFDKQGFLVENPQEFAERFKNPGKIKGAKAFVTWSRDADYYTSSGWRGTWAMEGGGCLMNQSIHTLDLLLEFLGSKPLSVGFNSSNRHLQGVIQVEDTMEAYLDWGSRRAFFYAVTGYSSNSPVMLELDCENFQIRMEEWEVTLWNGAEKVVYNFRTPPSQEEKSYWGNSHQKCIAAFYRSLVEENYSFPVDIESVNGTMDTVYKLYNR